MKIDVLIEYDEKLSEVTFSSKATQFTETRPARIGLSHARTDDLKIEMVEFIGEDWEFVQNVHELFHKEPSRKNWVLRVINPFEAATFEPEALFRLIYHFSMCISAKFYPKTWTWRCFILFLVKYEITLKIPDYNFFNPHQKAEFEKRLFAKYKHVSFIS